VKQLRHPERSSAKRNEVEGPSSLSLTPQQRERTSPQIASGSLPAQETSLLTTKTSRQNNKILRLRLEKPPRTNQPQRLASAQDDGTKSKPPRSPLTKTPATSRVSRRLNRARHQAQPPRIDTFADFLTHHARVKSDSAYIPYHFAGREALRPIVERLDQILSSGETDASLAICGGAQFGKTVLMLNLLAYLVAVRFRNVGYYLPDDDLVSGLVDGKLRPDVLDQIPWLARLMAVGKTLSPTGRAVNRKGAFLCTDGRRTALAFMRGLGKIPTSFSMDVVVQDEKDDLPEEHARFLSGRMTASNLRLTLLIGTQRYHGAGQNLAFTEGTQHIGLLTCTGCGARHNPETQWPGICRLEMPELPSQAWPRLTPEGHFASSRVARTTCCPGARSAQEAAEDHGDPFSERILKAASCVTTEESVVSPQVVRGTRENTAAQRAAATTEFPLAYSPGQTYALCCPDCGAALDREHPQWHALAPEREAQRRWSYRISQLLIPAIDLEQIVAAWQLAIRDPEHMTVFCTDRLALPKSTTQSLTPHDLEAARSTYTLSFSIGHPELTAVRSTERSVQPASIDSSMRFAGLDMGDQCWFVARAVEEKAPHQARLLWIESIAAERVRARVPELFRQLGISVLCVDAGPLRDLARDLVFILNGLDENSVPSSIDPSRNIYFGNRRTSEVAGAGPCAGQSNLLWHAASEKWQHLRCAAVEFTQREGQGLRHKLARTQEGRLYPLIAAHRDETIQRVVQELLPADSAQPRLLERADGTAERISAPRFLLPTPTEETRSMLDLYERHLLAGARQERSADGRTLRYLDKCENHFLLATAYAALAELLAPTVSETRSALPPFRPLPFTRPRRERSVIG
jgi:hypothetical protein